MAAVLVFAFAVVTSAIAMAVPMAVPMTAIVVSVAISVVISGGCVKVFTTEIPPLISVDPVLPLAVFTQLDNLVPLEPRRQASIFHISPRSAVTRSPEPVVAMKIVVMPAEEEHVIGNPNRYIDAGIGQEEHLRGSFYNHRSRRANVDIHVHLGTSLR